MIEELGIDSFACVAGDEEREAHSIEGFDELWASVAPGTDFEAMGCSRFRAMSGPIEPYVVDCIEQTLAKHELEPEAVDHVVFSMMDATLGLLRADFVARILETAGMVSCVPVVVSYQQCCGSLAALRYGWQLFAEDGVENALVVSLDFRAEDRDRVRSFALFGDAVTSCMISRRSEQGFRLAASAIGVDYEGMVGRDSFVSRQKVAQATLGKALREAGVEAGDVIRAFPTNMFLPLTQFHAAAAGIEKSKLYFDNVLQKYGHCGNADWMMNLLDYGQFEGINAGEHYLALASAPGFFACTLLAAVSPVSRPKIVADDLSGPAIAELLEEHIEEIKNAIPPESKHALALEHLRMPDITFWTAMDEGEVIGCCAIRRIGGDHGEIKSMHVARARRRRGVASILLRHLIAEAEGMGLSRLSVETGSLEFFKPAQRLYLSHGFEPCEPFGEYVQDPNSMFLTMAL